MGQLKTAKLTFKSYCGMSTEIDQTRFRIDVSALRKQAARRIKDARRTGQPVAIVDRGRRWEFETPEDAALVSDSDGILVLEVPEDGLADDQPDDDCLEACEDS